jgi:hypothetical protein
MLGFREVQAGVMGGPLVILFHVGAGVDARIQAATGPDARIVAYTQRRRGAYSAIGARGDNGAQLPDLGAAIAGLTVQPPRAVVLVGFSAGCQALRAYARDTRWTALLAVDGVHSSAPPEASQIDPWRAAIASVVEDPTKRRACWFTYSAIDPDGFRSVRATLETIVPAWAPLGVGPSLEVAQTHTLGASRGLEGFTDVEAFGFPGTDAAAHAAQVQVVLPRVLVWLFAELGLGEINGATAAAVEAAIGAHGGAPPVVQPGLGVPPPSMTPAIPMVLAGGVAIVAGVAAWGMARD